MRRWLDPTDGGRLGETPDYRFSLANERTFLAWIRTSMALVGGGLAVAAFVPPLRLPHVREAISVVLLVIGAVIALRAVDHWARSEQAMRLGRPLPRSVLPVILAVVAAAGAVLLLVLLLTSGLEQQ
jgi:inner membrane protein YidH